MRRPYVQGQEPWRLLPHPYYDKGTGRYYPNWHSVLLFFNMNFSSPSNRFTGYNDTSPDDARVMLDEIDPRGNPPSSEFMTNYWATLSGGQFGFGLNTPRDASNNPIIPTISQPSNQGNWYEPINACIDANAEAIWRAAGSLMTDNNRKRWIPSVVLVQNYEVHASAVYRGSIRTVAGQEYVIGDNTHIRYDLTFFTSQDIPSIPAGQRVRKLLGVLCHELAHNFFEFEDLYGPSGCTGYWDLFGSCTPPGNMSEVSSVHKELIGWLDDQHRIQVISGPSFANTSLSLRPYTTTGNAIKVIPDPQHNPSEYFILEYRKSTGNSLWVPDRALSQGGLLITHINERLRGAPDMWIMRDSPYFDPEFADYLDYGGSMWSDNFRLSGVLFPYRYTFTTFDKEAGGPHDITVVKNSFTEATQPSSNFYGDRLSGMRITDITLHDDQIHFQLSINSEPHVGWTVGDNDRYLSGRFTPESRGNPQEIIAYNNRSIALLECRQVHWFVRGRQDGSIDGWSLDPRDYHIVADVDGDGIDEIYIRSPQWAGILKWQDTAFRLVTAAQDQIGGWRLGPDNKELPANLDGDNRTEVYIRSPTHVGVIKLLDGQLQLQSIQDDRIGDWRLGPQDREWVGRFSQTQYDEILIHSPEGLGLLYWDSSNSRLVSRRIQQEWVDGWNLDGNDQLSIGDFDGDRLHEIYIRSRSHAGILKWSGDRFVSNWIRESNIEYARNSQTIPLTEQDISYAGRFLLNRDGILHRAGESGVAILTLEGGAMKVRSYKGRQFTDHLGVDRGLWTLNRGDKFILGNFNRVIRRFPRREDINLRDQLTNVFMYNNQALGMFGFDRPSNDATNPAEGEDYISLMWVSGSLTSVSGREQWIGRREILFREPI
jgi:M6 family metalloprotease-like protein